MYKFKCPKCGTRMRWWPRDFWEWRSGRTQCPSCGVWLQLPPALSTIAAPLLALPCVALDVSTYGRLWLGLVALMAVVNLLVCQSGSMRARVLPRGPHDSPLVRRWTVLSSIIGCLGLLLVWGCIAVVLYLRTVLRASEGLPPRGGIALLERTFARLHFGLWAVGLVAVACLALGAFALLMLWKARKADEAAAEESQGGEQSA